jgi:hypothetical protein
MESYKFYVQMDGQVYGPYTAAAVNNLQLLDDTLVTEESMNGEWLPASRFDFEEMMRKESAPSFRVNRDGSITYDQASEATTTPSQSNPTRTTLSNGSSHVNIPNSATRSDYFYSSGSGRLARAEDVDLSKWNWGAFFFSGLWSLFNGVWWFFPIMFVLQFFLIGNIINFGIMIYLGVSGNKLAWNNKEWSSYEAFRRAQSSWATAAAWVFGISFGIGVLSVLAM